MLRWLPNGKAQLLSWALSAWAREFNRDYGALVARTVVLGLAGATLVVAVVVQTSEDAEPVGEKLLSITHALWQTADDVLQAPNSLKLSLTLPETPLAALVTQWQSLLSGSDQPLHRLGQPGIHSQALTDLLTQINTHGHWQTHWLDSTGRYRVND